VDWTGKLGRLVHQNNIVNKEVKMNMSILKGIACGLAAIVLISGCQTTQNMSKTTKGTAIGAGTGAVLGAIIGHQKDDKEKGALIGGALGAIAGGLAGRYMDNQAKELEQVAETTRTADGGVMVTMKDSILFDVNSATLKPQSQESIQKISDILIKYPKTEITVAGHTDSTGKADYNQKLSERRANAVKFVLAEKGVAPGRVASIGFGADQPVASNATEEGRKQNRRVELRILPNKELQAESEGTVSTQ